MITNHLPFRYSQVPSFLLTTQTLTILVALWDDLRWSVGQTTSSHSVNSWESSTLLCSWSASVSTTSQLKDPLLRSYCNN